MKLSNSQRPTQQRAAHQVVCELRSKQGATAFDARVAARLLQVLQREQEQGAQADAAERAALQTLRGVGPSS